MAGGIDKFTKLLLHCDGTNGGTSFPDSSFFGHAATANVGVTTSTSSPKFGTASLLNSGASGSYLGLPDSTDWAVSTAFAIDFWALVADVTHTYALVCKSKPSSGYGWGLSVASGVVNWFAASADGNFDISASGGSSASTGVSITANTWNHIAFTWDGTNYRVFVNGVVATTMANSLPLFTTTDELVLGALKNEIGVGVISNSLNGGMDEIRFSNGVARWTSNFTPPTGPYDSWVSGAKRFRNFIEKRQGFAY